MRTADRRSRYPQADAIRLLLILVEAGEKTSAETDPAEAVRVIRSQIAFLARDSWVRYPDYLADELIDMALERNEVGLLDAAEDLLEDPEIDFDWLPMVRWRNGAYWWMTDAIAILTCHELLEYRPRASISGIAEHVYYLTENGYLFIEKNLNGIEVFDSIRKRARLASFINPGAPGAKLKLQQYEVEEYAATTMGATIPTRLDSVRQRATEVRNKWES